jgi:hypothetical protein
LSGSEIEITGKIDAAKNLVSKKRIVIDLCGNSKGAFCVLVVKEVPLGWPKGITS